MVETNHSVARRGRVGSPHLEGDGVRLVGKVSETTAFNKCSPFSDHSRAVELVASDNGLDGVISEPTSLSDKCW